MCHSWIMRFEQNYSVLRCGSVWYFLLNLLLRSYISLVFYQVNRNELEIKCSYFIVFCNTLKLNQYFFRISLFKNLSWSVKRMQLFKRTHELNNVNSYLYRIKGQLIISTKCSIYLFCDKPYLFPSSCYQTA